MVAEIEKPVSMCLNAHCCVRLAVASAIAMSST